MNLSEKLRQLEQAPATQREECLVRGVLQGQIFLSFFEGAEREEALAAMAALQRDCLINNVNSFGLLIAAEEGSYTYPPFITEHIELWERSINYLLYGDPALEQRIPPKIIEGVRQWAHLKICHLMSKLIQESAKDYPDLES